MKPVRRSRRWLIWAVMGAVLALALAWWGRERYRGAWVDAAIPPRPMLAGWPQALHEGVEEMEARARSGPRRIAALGELATLYHVNGFTAEARTAYEALEQLDPGEPRWAYRHALILSGFGEAEPALERMRRVVAEAPDYLPAALRLGEILLKQGARADAEAVLAKALERFPDDPYVALGLARCEIEAGQWEAARRRLEPVLRASDYTLGYDLIVPVYEHLGLAAQAAAIRGRAKASGAFRDFEDPWMEEMNTSCFDPFRLSLAAAEAKNRGDKAAARALLERAVSVSPNDATLRFQLGLVLADLSENAKAREQWEKCTALEPTFADGWAFLSGLLTSLGDHAGAQRVFAQGLAHCPDSPGLHLMKAKQLKAAGRLEEAVPVFRRAIELRPTEAEAYIELAMTLLKLNDTDGGIAELERALVAEPEHPVALTTLAFGAIASGRQQDALAWLRRVQDQPRVPRREVERLTRVYEQQFGRSSGQLRGF